MVLELARALGWRVAHFNRGVAMTTREKLNVGDIAVMHSDGGVNEEVRGAEIRVVRFITVGNRPSMIWAEVLTGPAKGSTYNVCRQDIRRVVR